MNNDLISREALKKAIETYDKFACLPDTRLMPFRELSEPEKDHEPYVHLRDILNAIDNAQPVPLPNEQIAWEQGYEAGLVQGKHDRPKGEWKNHRNDYGHNIADCSLCGKTMQWHDEDEDGIPRFCWYCGADMRGGRE